MGLESGGMGRQHQCIQLRTSSATLVEIRAGLMVLLWAIKQKMDCICIKTDCAVFVQSLVDLSSAPADFRTTLSSFCSFCSNFNVVKVVKVSRRC